MEPPLTGLRLLDCSEGFAGPMAAMYLGDYGAEVVKVERPGGEPGRERPGFPLWNRGKKRLECDIRTAEGAAIVRQWLAGADACVFSQPLAELESVGLGPTQIAAAFPSLCYLHTPSYLAGGVYDRLPESNNLLAAVSGAGWYQSSVTQVPIDHVIPHLLSMQGIWGAASMAAALFERLESRRGQTVTVGGVHSMLVCLTAQATHVAALPPIKPAGGPSGALPNYRLYQCGDGEWMMLAALTPGFRVIAFQTIGVLDELLVDPRIEGELAAVGLPENFGWVGETIARAMLARPRQEWLDALTEAGCPCGPVYTREQWLAHPQMDAVGMLIDLDDPELGKVRMPNLPIELSATPGRVTSPAPGRGERSAPSPWEPKPAAEGGEPSRAAGPLAGIRVLDLGAIVAGTYGASLLADLGADVVKVEPLTGDNLRANGLTFHGYNLGKRSLALNLAGDAGRELFYRMVREADVVIDNYRPGVLERLRVDYASLRAINPRIVSVSVTGYGTTGPLGSSPGFDPLLQAASGMMRSQGGDGPPIFYSMPVNDVGSAATAALGAILALIARERSGEGQLVRTTLLAQSLMMQSSEAVEYAGRPKPGRGGPDFLGPSALDRYYETADGWLKLEATRPGDRARLSEAGFAAADVTDVGLAEALGAAFKEFASADEAVANLEALGVRAAAARTLGALPFDPETREWELLDPVCPDGHDAWVVGQYARFSRTQRTGAKLPPGLGEHSLEVLGEVGLSDEEIGSLLESGTVVQGSPILFRPPGT